MAGEQAVAGYIPKLYNYYFDGYSSRKVWTSEERVPVKDWGPKGYGKCNRKQTRQKV